MPYFYKLKSKRYYSFDSENEYEEYITYIVESFKKQEIIHIEKTQGKEYCKKPKKELEDLWLDDIEKWYENPMIEIKFKPFIYTFNDTFLVMFETLEERDREYEKIIKNLTIF